MGLATRRTGAGTPAARLDGDVLIPLDAADVGGLLAAAHAAGSGLVDAPVRAGSVPVPVAEADFAQVVVNPSKVICVGLNYRTHIVETGRALPQSPRPLAKVAETPMGR